MDAFRAEERKLLARLCAVRSLGAYWGDPEVLVEDRIAFLKCMITDTVRLWPEPLRRLAEERYASAGPLPDNIQAWTVQATTLARSANRPVGLAERILDEFALWYIAKERAAAAQRLRKVDVLAELADPVRRRLQDLVSMETVEPAVATGLFNRSAIARLEQARARSLARGEQTRRELLERTRGLPVEFPKLLSVETQPDDPFLRYSTSVHLRHGDETNAHFAVDPRGKLFFLAAVARLHAVLVVGNGSCSGCGTALPERLMSSCAQCHCASYCGRRCQRRDWLAHRTWCAAAADLPEGPPLAGEVLANPVEEPAVVFGPLGCLWIDAAVVLDANGVRLGYWDGQGVVAQRAPLPLCPKAVKRFRRYAPTPAEEKASSNQAATAKAEIVRHRTGEATAADAPAAGPPEEPPNRRSRWRQRRETATQGEERAARLRLPSPLRPGAVETQQTDDERAQERAPGAREATGGPASRPRDGTAAVSRGGQVRDGRPDGF